MAVARDVRVRRRLVTGAAALVTALRSVHDSDAYPVHAHHVTAAWLYEGIEQAWVAEVDGVPVGHVALAEDGSGWHLTRFFVESAGRGTGAGSALLAAAESWADEAGCDLSLDVIDHNRAARALYERRGWHLIGRVTATWVTEDPPWPSAFAYRRPAQA